MAFDFHSDAPVYIEQQYQNSKNFVLPFIAKHKRTGLEIRVLKRMWQDWCFKAIFKGRVEANPC